SAAKRAHVVAQVGGVQHFRSFLRDLYVHRRKNLRGALAGWPRGRRAKEDVDRILAGLDIPGSVRAEDLDAEQHLRLCAAFGAGGADQPPAESRVLAQSVSEVIRIEKVTCHHSRPISRRTQALASRSACSSAVRNRSYSSSVSHSTPSSISSAALGATAPLRV